MQERSDNSSKLLRAAHSAEAAEFSTIFGSNTNPKWFEWIMHHAGTYFFSAALFLALLKLGITVYQFIKAPNKNITKHGSLLWNTLQVGILGTAIVGSLAATAVFVVATPALFFAAMALDTLRNIGLLFWNIGKLAHLRFQIREQLNDPNDHLTKLKYDAIKKSYLSNIKQHALGSLIGLATSIAVGVIFLFPQIGLSAVGLAGIVIGGVKITVAMMAGAGAGLALAIPLLPAAWQLSKWSASKVGKGVSKAFSFIKSACIRKSESLIVSTENDIAVPPKPISTTKLPTKHDDQLKIGINDIDAAINHSLKSSAFSLHSRFRETIIDHSENQDVAKTALHKMINEKISALEQEMKSSNNSGYRYFTEKQRPKREQKLYALLLLKYELLENEDEKNTLLKQYENDTLAYKNFALIKDKFGKITGLDSAIEYIESALPGVKQSFFLEQSDTQNIVEACKVYADRFGKKPEESYVIS